MSCHVTNCLMHLIGLLQISCDLKPGALIKLKRLHKQLIAPLNPQIVHFGAYDNGQ